MLGALTTLGIVGLGYWMGVAALRLSGIATRAPRLTALALAPGLGMGLVSLSLFFLLHLGLDRGNLWWILGAALVASALVTALTSGRGETRSTTRKDPPSMSKGARIVAGLMLLATLYVLSIHAWEMRQRKPRGAADAVSIWNAHAALLYRTGSGARERYRLFSTSRSGHPQYPLLLPGAVAGQFLIRGEEDPDIPILTAAAFLLGLTLLVYLAVAHLGNELLALPAVLILLSTPVLSNHSFSQYADLPMAYFALATVFGLASHLPGEHEAIFPSLLSGALVGLLAWTKNEGTVLAVLFVGLFVVFAWAGGRRRVEPTVLRFVLGAVPGLLAVGRFQALWLEAGQARAFFADVATWLPDLLTRAPEILQRFVCRLEPWCRGDRWGLVWPFLVAGAVLVCSAGSLSLRRKYIAAAFSLGIVTFLTVYVISPYPLTWHIEFSIDRVLMQLFPLAVVWVFGCLPLRQAATGAKSPPRPPSTGPRRRLGLREQHESGPR